MTLLNGCIGNSLKAEGLRLAGFIFFNISRRNNLNVLAYKDAFLEVT